MQASEFIRDVLYFLKNNLNAEIIDPLTNNEVHRFELNEGTGFFTSDSIGNVTGSLINSPSWAIGKIGSCLRFDLTPSQGVLLPNGSYIGWNPGSQFSLSCWFKPSGTINQGVGVCQITNNELKAIGFVLGSNNNFGVYNYNDITSTIGSLIMNNPCSNNSWANVVVTQNGSQYKFYKNSTLINSGNLINFGSISNFNSYIGNEQMSDGNSFSGDIDQIRFYKKEIDQNEINNIYNSGNGSEYILNNRGNSSAFIMTSYPQREVKYPLITIKLINYESISSGMQTTAMDVTLKIEVRVWARNEKEKNDLFTDVYERLRANQHITNGSVDNALHDFKMLGASESDDIGENGIKSRIGTFQYRFFNVV